MTVPYVTLACAAFWLKLREVCAVCQEDSSKAVLTSVNPAQEGACTEQGTALASALSVKTHPGFSETACVDQCRSLAIAVGPHVGDFGAAKPEGGCACRCMAGGWRNLPRGPRHMHLPVVSIESRIVVEMRMLHKKRFDTSKLLVEDQLTGMASEQK